MRSNSQPLTVSQQLLNAARAGNHLVLAKLLEENSSLDITKIKVGNDYSLLDCAAYYDESMSLDVINNKKKIVRRLLPYYKKDSAQFKNALNLIAKTGSYQTGKELLSVKNIEMDDLRSALNFSRKNGHQRISHLIEMDENPEPIKFKKTKISPLFKDHDNEEPLIFTDARNANLCEEDFLKHLKKSVKIEYELNGKTVNAIDLRVETLRKKYRSKNLRTALLGAICPAAALAVFAATFGGVYPDPALASILTIVILPIVYLPLAYIAYQSRMKEFGSVTAETLYLNWKSSKIASNKHDFTEKLKQVATKIESYQQQTQNVQTKEELQLLKKNIADSQLEYQKLKKEMAESVEFSDDKKPKIALRYMTRENFNAKKNLGIHDAKSNSKWVSKSESMRAFAGYSGEVLCAVDGSFAIGSAVASIIASKIGFGFLGAGVAGFLAGPVGVAIVITAAALLLTVACGVLLYRSSYKHEKKDIGKLNRGLVMAHDTCKNNADFTDINEQSKILNQSFKVMNDSLSLKEKELESVSVPNNSQHSSPVKLSNHPSAVFANLQKEEEIEPLLDPKRFTYDAKV